MLAETKTLTGAKIIIQTLKNLGVETIFGYPGGIVLSVYDELAKQNYIKHYLVRHEQAAIHAAEGYARVSGKCGTVIVTSGPGATNIVTGLANAYLDGTPLVAITGQVGAKLLHTDAFQEVNIVDITKSCTKKNFQVRDIKDLKPTLEKAYQTAMSGKKGPVLVDITKNVFSQTAEETQEFHFEHEEYVSRYEILHALELIKSAKRPVIIAGGGASNASKELTRFAHILNIPVVSTMQGLGVYPSSGENYIGMIGIFGQKSAIKCIEESDLVFAVGTRFSDRITCSLKNSGIETKLVQLDIDKSEIAKNIPVIEYIAGDAKRVLTEILSMLDSFSADKNWLNTAKGFAKEDTLPDKRSNKLHSFEVIQEIQKFIEGKNPVITTEVGQHQVWAARYFKFEEPKKFITSGGLGTMGFGLPAAMGASIAQNNSPVICLAGDGSIQMNIQELATCKDYVLPVKIFILNNGYLGMVRQFQEKSCEGRYFATKVSAPDFVKLAESYGLKGYRVENREQILPALQSAFEYEGTAIIDFVIEPMEVL